MEYRVPKKGEIYRHFKGNRYEILLIAKDSETLEEKVVYKEVDGDCAYVRSLSMFISPVDREKYPNATQEFRFELEQDMIMEYLNLKALDSKIDYLIRVKDRITESFISVVAQSLDFVENKEELYDRYEDVLRYLRTIAKYESRRLR